MPKAKFVLRGLAINEGSLVTAGDNPEAHIVLAKKRGGVLARARAWLTGKWIDAHGVGKEVVPLTTDQVLARTEFWIAFDNLRFAFMQSVDSIMCSDEEIDVPSLLRASVEQFATNVSALADTLPSPVVDMLKTLRAATATDTIAKADVVAALEQLDKFTEGEVLNASHNASPTKDAPMPTETNTAAPVTPAVTSDDVAKAAADAAAQKARADAAEQELVKLRAEKAAADLERTKLLDEKEAAEFVAKAKALNAPGADVAKLGRALRVITKADAQAASDVVEVIAGLAAQITANDKITETVGSNAPTGGATAEQKLKAIADEIRKAKPALTPQMAYVEAMNANPGLYADALAGR